MGIVKDNSSKVADATTKTQEHIAGIKAGTKNKALFGSGTSYSKATKTLMEVTKLSGSPVVATSKFPWVAAEYMVGQMGGAAGGGRNTIFGYQQDGKPVNRVLGNGFAMSLKLSDYKALRDNNDLIDVNSDIQGETTSCNRVIEEVTFVAKIDGEYVLGSLPMVLPRLDRNWGNMSREKHDQYLRVFNLDKNSYEKFQNLLKNEGEYPLGQLTEHLIQHHGNLLQELAISVDREEGYQGKFSALKNPQKEGPREKSGDLTDLNKRGTKLASRDARQGSSEKTSPYLDRATDERPSQTESPTKFKNTASQSQDIPPLEDQEIQTKLFSLKVNPNANMDMTPLADLIEKIKQEQSPSRSISPESSSSLSRSSSISSGRSGAD